MTPRPTVAPTVVTVRAGSAERLRRRDGPGCSILSFSCGILLVFAGPEAVESQQQCTGGGTCSTQQNQGACCSPGSGCQWNGASCSGAPPGPPNSGGGQQCTGGGTCSTQQNQGACCSPGSGCQWNGASCSGAHSGHTNGPPPSPGSGGTGQSNGATQSNNGHPNAGLSVSLISCSSGSVILNTVKPQFLTLDVYKRLSIHPQVGRDADPDGVSRMNQISTTCRGCQCPGGAPPKSGSAGDSVDFTCLDGSAPDTSVTSCCDEGQVCVAGVPPCSSCCQPCRHGTLSRVLEEFPTSAADMATATAQQGANGPIQQTSEAVYSGDEPVCIYGEPNFCPSAGMVWECQPPGSDKWVVPGQAGYESCITREGGFNADSSAYARPATFFGFDKWHQQCPLAIRSALALNTVSIKGGRWAVERACSDGSDPDWLTNAGTCSNQCAVAFYGFWSSCGGLDVSAGGSAGVPDRDKPLFWRYNETGTTIGEKIVTVTLNDLAAFYNLCLESDGSCPSGTLEAPTNTSTARDGWDNLGGFCVPDNFDSEMAGCPFSCGHGNVYKDNSGFDTGMCRPCPRGSFSCGDGCSPCPVGYDSHAGSESCAACPYPERCRGWTTAATGLYAGSITESNFFGCDQENGFRDIAFCSVCEFGFFSFRNKCLECPSVTWMPLVWMGGLAVLAPVVLWKLSKVADVAEDRADEYSQLVLMATIILPHLQSATWLMSLDLQWPDAIQQIAKWVGDVVFVDLGSLASLDCLTTSESSSNFKDFAPEAILTDNIDSDYDMAIDVDDPGDMVFLKFLLQTVLFCFILAVFLIDVQCQTILKHQKSRDHAANAMATGFCLMYPVLLKSAFGILDCTRGVPCDFKTQSCVYYLDLAPTTECYRMPIGQQYGSWFSGTGDNKFYMLWAVTVCTIYILIIPGLFFVSLFRAARSDSGFDAAETERFGWFLLRYKPRCWWWEFVKLVQKTVMIGTGVFLSNFQLCAESVGACADGSVVGEHSGLGMTEAHANILCADGSGPVQLSVDPETGLCAARSPGTATVYTGREYYPMSFIWSMTIMMTTLVITLVMQAWFAPFRNPPYAPGTMKHSPGDVVELICISLQILILGCGIIGYTKRSTIADVAMVMGALASIVIPTVFVIYSRRTHRDWYEDDAKDGMQSAATTNPLNVDDETAELGPAGTSEEVVEGAELEAAGITDQDV